MESKPQEFCPYKGLQPYEEADQKYFFGRERDIEIISSNLCATALTVLYGGSGVGKDSVLLAGVATKLRAEPGYSLVVFRNWQDGSFLESLKRETLAAISKGNAKVFQEIDLALPLDKFLRKCARASHTRLLFILDQFEEYFLYHAPSSNGNADAHFDAQFAKAVNRADLNANFLLALRDDGLSKLDRFQARIPNLLGNLLRLEHLDNESAQSAICEPLLRYNHEHLIDPPTSISGIETYVRGRASTPHGLLGRLLEDLRPGKVKFGESGAGETGDAAAVGIETPFLQMVLMRLWAERDRTTNLLDEEMYDHLGGAQNIVRTHLDNVMRDKFVNEEERDIASRLFQYLVTPENEKIALSKKVLAEWINEPIDRVQPVINLLSASDVRILRPVNLMPDQRAAERYEIFHDVLAPAILAWRTRYRVEVRAKEEAELRIEQERLAAEEREAEQQKQLKQAHELAETERQRAEHQQQLLAAELEAREAQEERAEAQRLRVEEHARTSKRLGRLSLALTVMVLVSFSFGLLAFVMAKRASLNEQNAKDGQAKALESAKEAENNEVLAKANEQRANDFAEQSRSLRVEGENAKAEAERLKVVANRQLNIANVERKKALDAEERAKGYQASAEAALADAAEQKQVAVINRLDALRAQAAAADSRKNAEQAQELSALYLKALEKYRDKQYQETVDMLTRALPLIGNSSLERAYAITLIGHSQSDLKRTADAVNSYDQALAIFRTNKDPKGEFNTIQSLGDTYSSMQGAENSDKAATYYNDAAKGYEALGNSADVANVQMKIAELYVGSDRKGDQEKAIKAYERAIAAYEQAGKRDEAAASLIRLGDLYKETDDFDQPADQDLAKAEDAYVQAVKVYKSRNDVKNTAETLVAIAELYADSEDTAKRNKAYDKYSEAASVYEKAGLEREAAIQFNKLASLQRRQRSPLAQENYEKAAKAFEKAGDPGGAATALIQVARTYNCQTCDDTKKRLAANYYRRVISLYEQAKSLSAMDRRNLTSSLTAIVRIYDKLKEKTLEEEYEKKLDALKNDPK